MIIDNYYAKHLSLEDESTSLNYLSLTMAMFLLLMPIKVVYAAFDCSTLVAKAVYDHNSLYERNYSISDAMRNICDVYREFKSDLDSGNLAASYGLFGGNVSYTSEQINEIGKQTCENTATQGLTENQRSTISSTLNSEALRVIETCIRTFSSGLMTDINYVGNDSFTIDLWFRPEPGTSNTTIFTDNTLIDDTLNCEGPLSNVQNGEELSHRIFSMRCNRINVRSEAEAEDGILHRGGTATIFTAAGSIERSLSIKVMSHNPIIPIETPEREWTLVGTTDIVSIDQSNYAIHGVTGNAEDYKICWQGTGGIDLCYKQNLSDSCVINTNMFPRGGVRMDDTNMTPQDNDDCIVANVVEFRAQQSTSTGDYRTRVYVFRRN